MNKNQVNLWCQELCCLLEEKKAFHIQVLPIQSIFADAFIIASAYSVRHLAALRDALGKACQHKGLKALVQGRADAPWSVVDAQGIFIHLFLEEERRTYDLESLWQQERNVENRGEEKRK